ncbi:CPBP family intramembrane glutamic endopeptidase [Desulfoscipio geothermicus]|uniref:CPBP family intramembrane glutamic endopeptidase n=1 Tax=Desulfoscipio geothermicus TaxID=39060 RepID=UPI002481FA20|nr:CPBP family intramembrane glutamic endopeptidase [Desulfoscipio geothermicus]
MFSIMHPTWRSVPELLFVFIAGYIFGGLYLRTKSLYLPIWVHGVNNTMLVAVYPYLIK